MEQPKEEPSNALFLSHLKALRESIGSGCFEDPQSKEKNYLTTVEAEMRSASMRCQRYTLLLVLYKGVEYLGHVTAEFDVIKPSDELFFDFEGTEVLCCSINDQELSPKEVFVKRRIQIPAKYQKEGANKVKIAFRNRYAGDGNGLHHFMDPEDKEEYLYSNFEPFSANKMFPCFDQPDLKGRFRFLALSPSNWVVISNEIEKTSLPASEAFDKLKEFDIPPAFISKELMEEKFTFKEFAEVPAISTYLYACIAGPYDFFTSSSKPEEGYPPMKIYMRRSLKKYVEPHAKEFFRITECGMRYYEDIFGCKYPFSKLDQIYCPEFNAGAMENVGAVTYTEHYVFKDPPTSDLLLHFSETILHELSHMWFGNLITMKWWNGLWLNESFATFISNLCISKAKGLQIKAVWTAFHKYKGWAYREDQQPTTHPITVAIENTEDAENLFDGITYMKGSSVLKQLYYLISHDTFCDGLKDYFKTYPWKNTELNDFIGTLQKALKQHGSTVDLNAWVKEWIFTKGLNELQPKIEVKDGVISNFTVTQKSAPNGDNVCRMHMLDIALYDEDFKSTTVEKVLVESKGETVIEKIKGMKAPKAVLLNVNDYSYSKVRLDIDSIHAFQANLNKINDSLTRMIIWRSYWDMVRDGLTSPQEYLKLVTAQLQYENEGPILSGALAYALSSIAFYVPLKYRTDEELLIFNSLMARLKVGSHKDIQKHLLDYAIHFARTEDGLKMLMKWLSEGTGFSETTLTQANRYSIIKKIYANSKFALEEKKKLLDSELEKDKSDDGVRVQKACEASIPTAENKEKFWKILLDEDTRENDHMLFAMMVGFNSRGQEELLKPYTEKYFEVLPGVFKKRPKRYAEEFFGAMKPLNDDEELLKKFEELSTKTDADQKTFKKLILEEIEDIKRALKGRQLYLDGLKKE